jgi:hypothetical protein
MDPEEGRHDQRLERKGKWTAEEDAQLLRAAAVPAVTSAIAADSGRTKKQCCNREAVCSESWQYRK